MVENRSVESLALNGRQFWQLVALTPGASYTPGGDRTRTGGSSIERGDHRLGTCTDGADHRGIIRTKVFAEVGLARLGASRDFPQVGAGAERPSRSRYDDRTHLGIARGRLECCRQRPRRLAVERIERVGPVDRKGEDRVVTPTQKYVGHRPVNRPGRFSRKALMPSRLSSEANSR